MSIQLGPGKLKGVLSSPTMTGGQGYVVLSGAFADAFVHVEVYDDNKQDQWGTWQQFTMEPQPGGHFAMKAIANNKYVTAENAGADFLIARSDTIGSWQLFDLVDAGGGYTAIKAVVNGKYVTTENGGTSGLLARSDVIGDWQKFRKVDVSTVSSFAAKVNWCWITAESAGAAALNVNRGTGWTFRQTFTVKDSAPAVRAYHISGVPPLLNSKVKVSLVSDPSDFAPLWDPYPGPAIVDCAIIPGRAFS